MIFLQNESIHFHINSSNAIRLNKQNWWSFSSIEINKPLPVPVQCLVEQIQIEKPTLDVATDLMPDHT